MTPTTLTPNQRRTLDRAHEAEARRVNSIFEVRAGNTLVVAANVFDAYRIKAAHNEARINQQFAESLRTDTMEEV